MVGNEVVVVVEDPTNKWVQCLLQKAIRYADFLSVQEAVKEMQKEIPSVRSKMTHSQTSL